MALCLKLHSLIHNPLWMLLTCQSILGWYSNNELCSQDKAFGFGQNTLRTLMKFYKTGQPKADSTGKHSDGNGSLMRLSPVASFIMTTLKKHSESLASNFTTHASKGADCCEFLGMLLVTSFQVYLCLKH